MTGKLERHENPCMLHGEALPFTIILGQEYSDQGLGLSKGEGIKNADLVPGNKQIRTVMNWRENRGIDDLLRPSRPLNVV